MFFWLWLLSKKFVCFKRKKRNIVKDRTFQSVFSFFQACHWIPNFEERRKSFFYSNIYMFRSNLTTTKWFFQVQVIFGGCYLSFLYFLKTMNIYHWKLSHAMLQLRISKSPNSFQLPEIEHFPGSKLYNFVLAHRLHESQTGKYLDKVTVAQIFLWKFYRLERITMKTRSLNWKVQYEKKSISAQPLFLVKVS